MRLNNSDTSMHVLIDLLVREAKNGIAALAEVRILALVADASLWPVVPVSSIAFNDKQAVRDEEVAHELVTNGVLVRVGYPMLVKGRHHSTLDTCWPCALRRRLRSFASVCAALVRVILQPLQGYVYSVGGGLVAFIRGLLPTSNTPLGATTDGKPSLGNQSPNDPTATAETTGYLGHRQALNDIQVVQFIGRRRVCQVLALPLAHALSRAVQRGASGNLETRQAERLTADGAVYGYLSALPCWAGFAPALFGEPAVATLAATEVTGAVSKARGRQFYGGSAPGTRDWLTIALGHCISPTGDNTNYSHYTTVVNWWATVETVMARYHDSMVEDMRRVVREELTSAK